MVFEIKQRQTQITCTRPFFNFMCPETVVFFHLVVLRKLLWLDDP